MNPQKRGKTSFFWNFFFPFTHPCIMFTLYIHLNSPKKCEICLKLSCRSWLNANNMKKRKNVLTWKILAWELCVVWVLAKRVQLLTKSFPRNIEFKNILKFTSCWNNRFKNSTFNVQHFYFDFINKSSLFIEKNSLIYI